MDHSAHVSLKNYRNNIELHLQNALALAENMRHVSTVTEGDSDLTRYLGCYLIPALNHWLTGAQAGNMKNLAELFERREKEAVVKQQEPAKMGDGHEVLTEPKE